jgi:hypothetical protein
MKAFTKHLFIFSILAFTIFSCTKEVKQQPSATNAQQMQEVAGSVNSSTTVATAPYTITLESVVNNGNNTYTWTWSVQNPNPGNGLNGTVQNLSHWGFILGTCVNFNDILSSAYSFNGANWTSFTAAYAVDPSQDCMTYPVLKFDAGTTGTAKTYYRITLYNDYAVDNNAIGYFKSGSRTDCGVFTFSGVGCLNDNGNIR